MKIDKGICSSQEGEQQQQEERTKRQIQRKKKEMYLYLYLFCVFTRNKFKYKYRDKEKYTPKGVCIVPQSIIKTKKSIKLFVKIKLRKWTNV